MNLDPTAIVALVAIGVLGTLLIVDTIVEIPYVHKVRLVVAAGIGAAVATLGLTLTRNGDTEPTQTPDDKPEPPPGGTTEDDHDDSIEEIEANRRRNEPDDRSDSDFWRDA